MKSPVSGVDSARALFESVGRASRAWLPPLLDNLATIPPTVCDADGCSIFLMQQDRLYLAATTRREARRQLFDPELAYTVDQVRLRRAAKDAAKRRRNPDGSFTGWVAAFDQPLNLEDQKENQASKQWARGIPSPVWSNRGGGFFPSPSKRPFLAVPMRHKGSVYGVIRIVRFRAEAQPFVAQDEQRLLAFGAHLAAFLVDHDLLKLGLEHYFRIWAAEDGHEVAVRITEAVPDLFNVDCCSFFQRDSENRFILQHSAASELLKKNSGDYNHFLAFEEGSKGNLYYLADGSSKTSACIQTQGPLLFGRDSKTWTLLHGRPEAAPFATESGGAFLDPGRASQDAKCEIHPRRSKSILLVPVRDIINPLQLAGVIRVVSTQRHRLSQANLVELDQFGRSLEHWLGETTRREIQEQAVRHLIEKLGNLAREGKPASQKWSAAAEIVAQGLNADAVTIFVQKDGFLEAEPAWSYLKPDQPDMLVAQHGLFCKFVGTMKYAIGQGRTGWPARYRRVLNLKDLDDLLELQRWNVEPGPFEPRANEGSHRYCELPDPGPFIAAPILDPHSTNVAGVIRALRVRDTYQGPFTTAHELILGTCATTLAGFLRVGEPTVVISYADAKLKDQLSSILKAINVTPISTGGTAPDSDAARQFEQFLDRAAAAVVIATPVQKSTKASG